MTTPTKPDKLNAFLASFIAGLTSVVTAFGKLLKAVGTAINAVKMDLTEIAGVATALGGVAYLTKWEYAAIIGGIAVIFAIERQPAAAKKADIQKLERLKGALLAAKASGKFDVMVDDVLKAL